MSHETQRLCAALFAGNLHSQFQVLTAADEAFFIELTEITEPTNNPMWESFSLLFVGPQDRVLPQQTWKLEHHKLGEMELFLTAVGKNSEGFLLYEAVFNLPRK